MALYRKLLEQLEGMFILADHHIESPTTVMIQAALETYFALSYVLHDADLINRRAACYYVGFVKNQNKAAKNAFIRAVQ
ncbi:hypothetical protein [Brevibacillus laterosporus]|uniref:Uncharacterized protein n=1 Tax=Brevibacillus laterosporus TaxID=1465 RepID=A0A0F7EJ56_BRELA|nr:hypothetical protein EX87_20340 [Brevibacillus laterosporus]